MKKIILFAIISFSVKLNSQTQAYLDVNNVKALILNRNDMFWDAAGSGAPKYEVPKNSGKHCNFANSVWIGGYDGGGQLQMAGATYRQQGFDFFPGPLDTLTGNTNSVTSNSFNKVWKVSTADINLFINAWNTGSITANTYTTTNAIMTWPANGNVSSGYSKALAPFFDVNNDGVYNYMNGDYPKIKGDQMIFYVVNDKLDIHSETLGLPLGIEMQVSAYAYNCPTALGLYPELNYTTFYNYKLINRSTNTYTRTTLGIWCDGDIGTYTNDYIGCDTAHGNYLGYMYNATDGVYGNYPPILSYQVLKGPRINQMDGIDNDHNGSIDEPNEEARFNNFMFYNNNIGPVLPQTTNPSTPLHYNNYLNHTWKNGSPLRADSMGYLSATNTVASTSYAYPGNIQTNTGWTESFRNNTPGDRRLIIGNGPFKFLPNEMQEFEFSILTTFDSTANGYKNLTKVVNQNSNVSNFYGLLNKPSCQSIINGLKEQLPEKMNLQLIPNPASDMVNIKSDVELSGSIINLYNSLGQFISSDKIETSSYKLDVRELPSGVYFIELRTKNGNRVSKLVKN